LLIGTGMALYEVPKLLKAGMRQELIAFSALLLVAVCLAGALVLRLPVPNPTQGIEMLFGPLCRMLYPGG
ncbi:MAG: hypothetical protein ACPLTR_12295, partial [Thermacetogeniaceae bacterium]